MTDANWIDISTLHHPGVEEQIDVNAAPGTLEALKYRHRPRAYTGQPEAEWSLGRWPARTRGDGG